MEIKKMGIKYSYIVDCIKFIESNEQRIKNMLLDYECHIKSDRHPSGVDVKTLTFSKKNVKICFSPLRIDFDYGFASALDEDVNSFLWYIRSVIQSQNNIAYIFSGSMSIKDELISDIAGQKGAFGGRILNYEIKTFSHATTKSYLNEKATIFSVKHEQDGSMVDVEISPIDFNKYIDYIWVDDKN